MTTEKKYWTKRDDEILRLGFILGYTYPEIAEVIGKTPGAVKTRSAINQLSRRVGRYKARKRKHEPRETLSWIVEKWFDEAEPKPEPLPSILQYKEIIQEQQIVRNARDKDKPKTELKPKTQIVRPTQAKEWWET